MKTDKKPPLRGRRPLRPSSNTVTPLRTPAYSTKPQMKGLEIRPQNPTVSCDLKALTKMVQDELGAINVKTTEFPSIASTDGCNLFKRGRFYDVYSEKRNERLRKKLSESENDEPKTAYNLGVTKKKDSKKSEILKKSIMATTMSVDRSQHPRYSLRSTSRKPPLPAPMDIDEKMTAKKVPSSKTRRK